MSVATAVGRRLPQRASREGSPLMTAAWVLLGVLGVLVMAGNAAWMATGGHLYVVSTASMSPATPVGSLVLVRPAATIVVGDVISFHPYGNPDVTYTHRVISVADGPIYRTRGDQAGADDPWPLHPSDVIGTAAAVLPGVGWLVRAMPWLLIGSIISLLLLGMIERRRRRPYAVLAAVILVCVPLLLWHPLVRGDMVGTAAPAPSELRVKLVNTGLLPVDFSIPKGDEAVVPAGDAVQLTGPVDSRGGLWIDALVSLPWWGWVLLAAICLSPLAFSVLHATEEATPPRGGSRQPDAADCDAAEADAPDEQEPDPAPHEAEAPAGGWVVGVRARSAGAMGRLAGASMGAAPTR